MTRFPKTRLHGTPFTEVSRSSCMPLVNTVKFITFIGLFRERYLACYLAIGVPAMNSSALSVPEGQFLIT
jgi:hypothetical protein